MTGTTITPHLNFGGRCEEALAFSGNAPGATVKMVMRFHESTGPPPATLRAGLDKKIMHASYFDGMVTDRLGPGRMVMVPGPINSEQLDRNVSESGDQKCSLLCVDSACCRSRKE
jgi:uncharacterized glyoxalase superfamily protein PhnB